MSVEATTTANQVTLSLKLLVDPKAKKVIFAEAKKDFVDFLFHILSLPFSTVVKLLKNEQGTAGSLQSLYRSLESLQTECFLSNLTCNTVLLPKHPISLPLLSIRHTPIHVTHFKCPDDNYVSDRVGVTCPRNVFNNKGSLEPCRKPMSQVTYAYVEPSSSNVHPGFVKEVVPFIVTDNLEVKPMSLTLIKSLVTDFDYLVEEDVQFGQTEGLALLRAFMETKDVLTTVFLGNKKKTDK